MGNWRGHAACNQYVEDQRSGKEIKSEALKKYDKVKHFNERYRNHEQSMLAEIKMYNDRKNEKDYDGTVSESYE